MAATRTRKDVITCSVRARCWLDRQLQEPRLLIFWRPGPDDGRAGLVCVPDVCDNPACSCDDVRLTVYPVTEQLHHVELADELVVRLVYEPPAPEDKGRWEVQVEADTGRVLAGERGAPPELLELMRRNVDAEVLALLARETARVKGRPPASAADPHRARAPGQTMLPLPPPPTTPGRNDPCPCGSGRKFKKCCVEKAAGR